MNIESLQDIQEVKMSFSAKFNLAAEWFDERLTWNDLNDDKFLNIPNQEILSKLWFPSVIFKNTPNNYETMVDSKARLLVKKEGNYTLSSVHEMEETAYYKGSENTIQYSRDFFHQFKCHFELQNYPFDTQICTFLLKRPNKVEKFVKFVPDKLGYSGPLKMAEFSVIAWTMTAETESKDVDIKVKIILKRRVSQHLLSTYLPSLCILTIAQVCIACHQLCEDFYLQVTLFFKKEHFKTAIPLAITSMLVMYTLKGSITSKLPATSYIKFVDIWLLYGLLVPFFILLLLVLIEHLPEKSKVLFIKSREKEQTDIRKMIEHLPNVSQEGNILSFFTLFKLMITFFNHKKNQVIFHK